MTMNLRLMGAIVGDVIGSVYEFNPTKDYHFKLVDERMEYTDDTVMTVAVADWLLHDASLSHAALAHRMRRWGKKYRYPMGAYGSMFSSWLDREEMGAYHSFGNGSAMRVSPVGFFFDSIEETLQYAQVSAEVTHDHPEGIKGAQATAAAIFLARTRKSKEEIRTYLMHQFGYELNRTCDEIRPSYHFEASCQETVPQSIIAFLDSKDYEDAIRLTVSLGGDADTMGAITGAIAAAYYDEMPTALYDFVWRQLPDDIREVVTDFRE